LWTIVCGAKADRRASPSLAQKAKARARSPPPSGGAGQGGARAVVANTCATPHIDQTHRCPAFKYQGACMENADLLRVVPIGGQFSSVL
jgi:hypothetical protein